jgi:hypothetical protein
LSLAVLFAIGSLPKLANPAPIAAVWRFYRLPPWFLTVTGAVELVTAAALARRATARLGGTLAAGVMMGAVVANLRHPRTRPLVLVNLALAGCGVMVVRDPR